MAAAPSAPPPPPSRPVPEEEKRLECLARCPSAPPPPPSRPVPWPPSSRPVPEEEGLALGFLRFIYAKKKETRNREAIGAMKAHLHGVRLSDGVVELFGQALAVMQAQSAASRAIRDVTFQQLWKDKSFNGYDCIGNRIIDDGNEDYKTFALAACELNSDTKRTLSAMSLLWPSVSPTSPDTHTSVENVGDLVEVHMGALRGSNHEWQFRLRLVGPDHIMAFNHFCQMMRLIHCLTAIFVRGSLKYSPDTRICKLSAESSVCPMYRLFREGWIYGSCLQRARLLVEVLRVSPQFQH